MAQQQIAASLFDINLRARPAALVSLAILATILTIPTAKAQTFTVLHTFTGGADGAAPAAGLTEDAAGNFYGTASAGGSPACTFGCGTVYKLTHHGSSWLFNAIYEFTSTNHGPFEP